MRQPHTLRFDSDLWEEIKRIGAKLRPKENHTDFIERAVWERIRRIEENKNGKKQD